MRKVIYTLLIAVTCLLTSTLQVNAQQTWAIVRLSVCNLHAKADFASPLETQALLGTPVRVVKFDRWYQIQLPDEYIAWVHRDAIRCVTPHELEAWNQAEKVVVTAHYGFVYSLPDEESLPISDIVSGNRLKLIGRKGKFYHVEYPDGRQGYLLRRLACPETKWRKQLQCSAESILHTASTLTGVPYLWAGTSSKGVDCSGLVQTVFRLHDVIVPRNASQQAKVGQRINISPDNSNLQAGDLLLFGKPATDTEKEQIVHVGIYMGEGLFIHSQGDVHVSSLNPQDERYDAFNHGRLLYATRILPYINKVKEVRTLPNHPYFQEKIAITE